MVFVLRSTQLFFSPSNSPCRSPVKMAVANNGRQVGASAFSSLGTSSSRRYCGRRLGALRRSTAAAGLAPTHFSRLIASSKMRCMSPRRWFSDLGAKSRDLP